MSRRDLTPSSLFAKRNFELRFWQIRHRASLIVPPVVRCATPTLEAEKNYH
jgi:hypothetical protein